MSKELANVAFKGGEVVIKGTVNTAVFVVKVAGQTVATIVHHARGPGRIA